MELFIPLEGDGGTEASEAKKLVTNEYSAVALSIKTRNMDRSRASMGSFCSTCFVLSIGASKMRSITYISFVVSLKCESDTGSIDPSICQSLQVKDIIFVFLACTGDNDLRFF
jgi:hypothetical protein